MTVYDRPFEIETWRAVIDRPYSFRDTYGGIIHDERPRR